MAWSMEDVLQAHGWTPADWAERADAPEQAVQDLLLGRDPKPERETLLRLADVASLDPLLIAEIADALGVTWEDVTAGRVVWPIPQVAQEEPSPKPLDLDTLQAQLHDSAEDPR